MHQPPSEAGSTAYGHVLPMDLHVPPQAYHPYYRKGVGEDGSGQVAVHSRILEMRKEKSRDAARSRRGKENYEFYELAKMLPLPGAITSQLDKASIIRLTISYLKLRDFSAHGDPPWTRDPPPSNKTLKGGPIRPRSMTAVSMEIFEQHQGTHILQSLDGFAFSLSADGRFLYVSETVSIYLGLSQVEMTGSSVFDYIHQQDHAEMADQLGINLAQNQPLASPGSVTSDDGAVAAAPTMTLNNNLPYKGIQRSFCVRMKSTLTKRGCHFKSSGYRVVLVLSHFRPQYSFSHSRKQPPTIMGMVALAIALPPPSVNEVRLESDMFVTRLTFDFRVAHCEPKVSELLDWTAEELTGVNMYILCHGQDVQKLRKCHTDLIDKGQVMSGYYRIINKCGGFTWVQTCATVITNSKNADEQSIICVNYVISGTEFENCVMDYTQLRRSANLKPDDHSSSEQEPSPDRRRDSRSPAAEASTTPSPRSNPEGQQTVAGLEGGQERSKKALRNSHAASAECVGVDNGPISLCREATKPLEINIDPYPDPGKVTRSAERQQHKAAERKRKTSADELSNSSKHSRPASTSSLTSSPLDGGRFLPPVEVAKSGSPELQQQRGLDSPRGDKELDSAPEERVAARHWKRPGSGGAAIVGGYGDAAMSVRELEDVMNKHLPANSPDKAAPTPRGAIQWIGGSQPPLPATSLLRQLYVNRESVIRSGAHVSRPSYYADGGGSTLPTPPGGGGEPGYGDQPPQFMSLQAAKVAAESYGLTYSSAPPPATYMDTYSAMTPPASVSPREKFHSTITDSASFSEAASAAAAAAMPHMRHYVTDPPGLQHLPLKPQVFVHPGSLDYGQTPTLADQQQLYSHHASSFHLYHPASSGVKTQANGAAWYPQSNS